MVGRKWNSTSYRYGFNGKENDNEVKGEGNQQDYGMRIYDPRLGRFLSVDPLTKSYPELTPYQFASNRPIDGIDLDGKEYMKNEKSVYLLFQFKQPDIEGKYVMTDLWIKDQKVHDIIMNVPDPPESDNDSQPAQAKIKELKGNQNNSKKLKAQQNRQIKYAQRSLRGDAVGLVMDAVIGGYSWLYRLSYDKQIMHGSRSINALNDADILLRKATKLSGFPSELSAFTTDLVNYLTDGTEPSNSVSRPFIRTWGDLIYNKREEISNGTYSFQAELTIPETHYTDGNTGRQFYTERVVGNPDPDLKKARETLKSVPVKEPPVLTSGN
jgi:RHS repeat-associated protein